MDCHAPDSAKSQLPGDRGSASHARDCLTRNILSKKVNISLRRNQGWGGKEFLMAALGQQNLLASWGDALWSILLREVGSRHPPAMAKGRAHSRNRNGQRPASFRMLLWHYNVSQGSVWPQTGFISCSLDRRPLSLLSLICIMSRKMSLKKKKKKGKMSLTELAFV